MDEHTVVKKLDQVRHELNSLSGLVLLIDDNSDTQAELRAIGATLERIEGVLGEIRDAVT